MIQKPFRLEESDIKILNEVKEEHGFSSEAEALRFIIRKYNEEQRRENGRREAVLKAIEENQDLLIDALNTILIENSIEICQPVSLRESPVFIKSREYRKERLAHLKEKKDHQNKKRGDKIVP